MQKIKLTFRNPFEAQFRNMAARAEQTAAKVIDYVMKLSPRERFAVIGGSVFVVLFVLIFGIIGPLVQARSNLEKAVIEKDQQLRKIYVMSANIRALNAVSRVSTSGRTSLIGYLQELSKQLNLADRVEYMRPMTDLSEANRESVDVKMKDLYQEDLIGLLFGIENSQFPIKIKKLNLKKGEKGDLLEVTFQAVSYG